MALLGVWVVYHVPHKLVVATIEYIAPDTLMLKISFHSCAQVFMWGQLLALRCHFVSFAAYLNSAFCACDHLHVLTCFVNWRSGDCTNI